MIMAHRLKTKSPAVSLLIPATLIFFALSPAQDKTSRPDIKQTADGIPYLSTGVGYDSRVNLPKFSTRLVFSTRNQKYLADIDVEISPGPRGSPTKVKSLGPWLDIDLPPGKYKLKARTNKGQEATKTFEVVKGRMSRVKVVWDISDEDI